MGLEFRLTTPWRVAPRWLGCTSPGCGGFGHQRDDRQRRPPVGGTQQRRLLCQRWGGDNRPRTLSEPQREASVATKGVAKKLASLGPQSGAVDLNSSPTSQQFGLEPRDITGLCTGAETMGVLNWLGTFQVLLAEGSVRETRVALVGSLATCIIECLFFSPWLVSLTYAPLEFGLMESTSEGVEIEHPLSNTSKPLVVAADSTKPPRVPFARSLGLEDLEFLVMEVDSPDSLRDPCARQVVLL